MKRTIHGPRPTQDEAALVYADCMRTVDASWTVPEVFWPIFNRGIAAMWPSESGLESVKTKAWRIRERGERKDG